MAEASSVPSPSAGSMDPSSTVMLDGLLVDGRNAKMLLCLRCPSTVLQPRLGTYTQVQFHLPHMRQKKVDPEDCQQPTPNTTTTELLDQFWAVDDIYTFDNMGFSNTVGDTKFLVCADCEVGPLGYHNLTTKMSYVALQRVRHQ